MRAAPATITASTFLYPWDLADLGVDEALTAVAADGFGAVDLTATYHPVTTFSPGGPRRRLVTTSEGGVLFPAREERYGAVRPQLWPDAGVLDVWPRAATVAREVGLRLTAWMPMLYQPWLVRRHPECARRLPTQDPSPNGLCPSSPAVREFLAMLVADVAAQHELDLVQLEGVSFPPFDGHWPHPRALVSLPDWTRWLLGLCFCDSCVAVAEAEGVDAEGLRTRIAEEIYALWNGSPVQSGEVADLHADRLTSDPDYGRFCELREQAPVALVRRIATELRVESPRTEVSLYGPLDSHGTPWRAEDVAEDIASVQALCAPMQPGAAEQAKALAERSGARLRTVHWCSAQQGGALAPVFEAGLRSSVELGVDEVNVFNWAMLPRSLVAEVVPLLRRLEAEIPAVAEVRS